MTTTEKAEPASVRPATKATDNEDWRAKYEEERLRLAKLWVAYRDVENELAEVKAAAAAKAPPASAAPVPAEPVDAPLSAR